MCRSRERERPERVPSINSSSPFSFPLSVFFSLLFFFFFSSPVSHTYSNILYNNILYTYNDCSSLSYIPIYRLSIFYFTYTETTIFDTFDSIYQHAPISAHQHVDQAQDPPTPSIRPCPPLNWGLPPQGQKIPEPSSKRFRQ